MDGCIDRSIDPSTDQPRIATNQPTGRFIDGSNNSMVQSIERLIERSNARPTKRPSDQATKRPTDQPTGQLMDGSNRGVLVRSLGKWMGFRRPLGLGFRGGARCGELRVC